MLWQPRVSKLKLKEVFEKRLISQRSENAYVYEIVVGAEPALDVGELNIVNETNFDEPTITTMFSRSTLRFVGSEILGLIPESLEVTRDRTSRGETTDSKQFPNSIEVTADLITNSVDFRYLISDQLEELEIRVIIIMNKKLNIDLVDNQNIEVNVTSFGFREAETTSIRDTCTWLQKGYKWHLVRNQRRESRCIQLRTNHENSGNIRGLPSLMWPGLALRLCRKRTADGSTKSEHESYTSQRSIQDQNRTITLILEFLNHQRLIMLISSDKKIVFVKQMIIATLQKWHYYPKETEIVPVGYRPFDIKDIRIVRDMRVLHEERTLGEQLDCCQIARCAVLTSKPEVPRGIVIRTDPESQRQKDILFKFQSSYVLLRNLKACNRAAETLMDPRQRMRFSVPEIKTTGWIYSEDLGELILCVAQEVKKLSMNLLMLSDMMKKSGNFIRGTIEYENYKHTIQNVMHAARYAGPLFRAVSRFTIPLQSESPRRIGILD